jgi:hypothetical protein
MPTNDEIAVDILTRIEDLRRVSAGLERISQPCQKLMGDWFAGGEKPDADELHTTTMVIQCVGYLRMYCRSVEKNLNKILEKVGFTVTPPVSNSPP